MASGVFPFTPRKVEGEDNLPPDKLALLEAKREQDFLTERQLAYVAMTRAARDLTIVCPDVNAYGKKSTVSTFVLEAGLSLGQNVEGKSTPDSEGSVKTASSLFELAWGSARMES